MEFKKNRSHITGFQYHGQEYSHLGQWKSKIHGEWRIITVCLTL